MEFRTAGPQDTGAIARLHADSWRRHYRGAFSDEFLDGDVADNRLTVWTQRLRDPSPGHCTIVAEDAGVVVGFAHTVFDDDPRWGALLDNLHVTYDAKRSGIGTRLMAGTAESLLARPRPTGLYLWVLEQNTAAQAFYEARGGVRVERGLGQAPGGGTPARYRYAWPDPATLRTTA
jgi:ribosomal protein S18 acetylase RimI-like enzyme